MRPWRRQLRFRKFDCTLWGFPNRRPTGAAGLHDSEGREREGLDVHDRKAEQSKARNIGQGLTGEVRRRAVRLCGARFADLA